MKLTLLFLTIGLLQVSGSIYSQTTKLTLQIRDSKVAEILDAIENQSEFRFAYSPGYIDLERRLSVDVKEKTLEQCLQIIFNETDVKYEIIDRHILLFPDAMDRGSGTVGTSSYSKISQQRTVSGKVTDSGGQPLPGVSIIIKGTTQGTVTDVNGEYSLVNLPSDAALVFSFVGMKTKEVIVGSQTNINLTMEEETIGLEEVVAIGYGTMKKSDLTGSVARIEMDDKINQANVNLLQALVGRSAGVNLEQQSVSPGTDLTLSIRGQTSLSASDRPLIVVDGIIYNGSISNINVNDIESIDILKDASAAAVYGSRSANGVILITTKKGISEKPTLSFNMYYGYQDMSNNPVKVMNANQYAIRLIDYYYQQDLYQWYKTNPSNYSRKPIRPDITNREIVASRLRTEEEKENYLAGNEIDWVDEVMRIAPIQNYNLSISGKTNRTNYFFSGSYTDQKGILLNDEFFRITLFSSYETKLKDWLTLGFNTSYTYRDYSGLKVNLTNALQASPLADNKINSPNYDMYLTGELYMPYPLNNLYVDNKDITNTLFIIGRTKIEIPWIKGLSYELNYSNNYSNRRYDTFYPSTTPQGSTNRGLAHKNPSETRDWIVNNIITYIKNFGDHRVNSTLLYSAEGQDGNSAYISAQGFDNESLGYNNVGLAEIPTVSSSAFEQNSISYFMRANYAYLSRYMVTATLRRDGFSGFGEENKWATFPSVSLAWVASDEKFLNDLNFYAKLRVSYGKNGNQGIGRYASLSRMYSDAYVFGSETAITVTPNTLGNADLGWETTKSFNIGLDYGFLSNRIHGSIDLYKAKTSDVLVTRSLPPSSGYNEVWMNLGGLDNKGIELELNSINIDANPFRWESNFIFSLNRNKITKLYGGKEDKDVGNQWFVGEPLGAIYDYEMSGGVWTEEEFFSGKIPFTGWYPGQFRYVDQNKDDKLDPTNDRAIIGYKNPSYRFSINNTLSYKNITLSFFINSIQGGKNYYLQDNTSFLNGSYNSDDVYRINALTIRQYWTPDNNVSNATGIYSAQPLYGGIYQSRSFVRLQDVSISYKFNNRLIENYNLGYCEIYLSGKNLYTWTKWSGWDPEAAAESAGHRIFSNANEPLMRQVIVGFRLNF